MSKVRSDTVVYFIGDAILDNYHHLNDKGRDLKKEVSELGFTVHNYAVDGTKVSDIIDGIIPHKQYRESRTYPYLTDKDGKLKPLSLLANHANINKSFPSAYGTSLHFGNADNNESLAVISMGGNNLREKFAHLLLGVESYMKAVVTPEFTRDYERVIQSVRSSCPKIILISVYLPYLGPGSSYAKYHKFSHATTTAWMKFLYAIAKKHNIPVLDLSRTFDVNNRAHYGAIETHPSNISSKCIAECIAHIHDNYNGHKIYYAPACNAQAIRAE